jgi:hypothetical protein
VVTYNSLLECDAVWFRISSCFGGTCCLYLQNICFVFLPDVIGMFCLSFRFVGSLRDCVFMQDFPLM